jgi:dethiobiotin synthetase
MQKQIFISGIDTDCGKTYITGHLAKKIRESGINVITAKLVQTGCVGISEDIIEHRKAMGIDILPEDENGNTCPMVYSFPASPHLSAEIDKRPFEIEKVEKAFSSLKSKYELLLIEGAGGLTVPLTTELLTSDYLQKSEMPLILVSSSRLGSINHTLLSIDFCIKNNINLLTIIYNQFPDDDKQIAQSSYQFLKEYIKIKFPSVSLIHGSMLNKSAENDIDWIVNI